ncbi:hypothetical protein GE061_005291 [Apolygus lucorum]|uniref:Uncharacterized protein n=1 Tax=Apolygus lucorum TaxID=248454 RepID=A0A6A4IQU0_APOLU|nr:hypothetical protein GE061_005291 [Apolygus lucorum]
MEDEAKKLTKDYSNYLVVNVNQDVKSVEDAIDDTLTRLDEFSGLVDVISCQVNPGIATDILSRKEELFDLFQRVRKLELTVTQIRNTVDTFDQLVTTAETELNATTEGRIKNFLKPMFTKRSSMETTTPTFTEPPIFSTKDLFSNSRPQT